MTKNRLKKINIAGTWYIILEMDLHALSRDEIQHWLADVMPVLEKKAASHCRTSKRKVNLKAVSSHARAAPIGIAIPR